MSSLHKLEDDRQNRMQSIVVHEMVPNKEKMLTQPQL